MVIFSEEIIAEIIKAGTEQELEKIVEDSILHIDSLNLYNKENFLINMIVSLQAKKGEQLSLDVTRNVITAIELFRDHRKRHRGPFF
jgi:hypothetical protein